MKNNIPQSSAAFILPDQSKGNSITDRDIKKNQLRITVSFKKYFPDKDDMLVFEHNKEEYEVKFTYRNNTKQNRSHILKLGSTLMQKLNINPSSV